MKNLRHLARTVIVTLCGLASAVLASDPATPQLRGRFETSADGSSRKFVLEWDAVSNATYRVQAAENLEPGTPWKTFDVVTSKSNLEKLTIIPERSLELQTSRFFRLELPQPEIFAVEPAFLPAGVETTIYVVGQCFSDNMELRIGPRALTNREIINPNLMRAAFTPATPGAYVFELVVASRVLHTFTVFAVDAVGNQDLLSQEVPGFPPGSPARATDGIRAMDSDLRASAFTKRSELLARAAEAGAARRVLTGGYGWNVNSDFTRQMPNFIRYQLRSKTTEAKVVLGGIKTSEESFRAYDDDDDDDNGGWAAVAIPAFMKNARKAKTSEAVVNVRRMNNWPGTFDLQPFSGELQHQVVDIVVPGVGIDLIWGRCYRSQTGSNSPMGNGWTHFYDIRVEQSGTDLVLRDGTGRRDLFIRQADGTYRRDGFFYEITLDAMNRVKVKFPWLGEWEFNPFDGSPIAGKISTSRDANGNTMRFYYEFNHPTSPANGNLTEIVDTLGRTNRITYRDSGGQPVISSFTDSQGRVVVQYELSDSTGDLVSVRTLPVTGTPNGNDFPGGKTNTYAYTTGFADQRLNHNLIRVTDPSGQTWLSVTYRTNEVPTAGNFDAVDFIQRGPYRSYLRRFPITPAPSNDFAIVKAIVNHSGNVSEMSFDARHRCLRQLEYTGRAKPDLATTQTENRPAGKLRPCDSTGSLCDPDYFETRANYNRDNLCISVTFPRGNSVQYRYGRDFDKNSNPRKTGDLLVVRELPVINPLDPDSDDDGVLDSTERVWRFEIDPRFGSPAMGRYAGGQFAAGGGMGRAARDENVSLRSLLGEKTKTLGRFASGPRQTTSMDGSFSHRASVQDFEKNTEVVSGGFGIRMTDPLGNATVVTYDPAGNPVTVQFNPKEISVDRSFSWNSRGQLIATTNAPDANGQRRIDTATYYDSGPQAGYLRTATVDARGPTPIVTTYEYDARGNVTRIIDPRGFDTLITYNQLDQPVQAQSAPNVLGTNLRNTTDFTYDANDNIVQIDYDNRDGNGVLDAANPKWTTQCRYDLLNRMTDCWVDKDGSLVLICEQVAYDAFDNVVLYRSPEALNGHDPNAIVRFEYDERNLLFRCSPAPGTGQGATVQWDYDGNGNLAKITQATSQLDARIETRAYDGFDRLISLFDPMGHKAEFAYDDNDNFVMHKWFGKTEEGPIGVANVRYHEWRWRYNSRDLPVSSRRLHFDPATQAPIGDGESTHTYAYAPNGQLLSETDDNGHTTRYSYDTALRLSSVIDPKTNTIMYGYDPGGNVVSVTEIDRSDLPGPEQRFSLTYDYDPLGRSTRRTDNLGNNESWSFDSRGNCLRAVDAVGNPTLYTYDGLNRVTLVVVDLDRDGALDVADISRTYVWDDNSRLSSETDDNGNTTSYVYDSLDRKTLATSPDGTRHHFVWDSRSELVSYTDPNGTVFSNRYDLLSRRVRTDITPGPGVTPDTTFEEFHYNGPSELVSASNDVSVTTFSYDSHGNCDRIITDGYQMLKSFDAEGNQISLIYPSGPVLHYTYDAANRLRDLECTGCIGTDPLGIATFAYDGPDRVSRITRANGINTRVAWDGIANSPSQPGDFGWKQVAGIRHVRAGTAISVYLSSNRWDHAQNTAARDNHLQGAVDVIQALRFGYDGANRLVQSQSQTGGSIPSETVYNLDGNGNRVTVTTDGMAVPYVMESTQPPADFQMDQYTFTPFGGQRYDNNGNLVSSDTAAGSITYSYDARNRLVLVTGSHGSAIVPIVSYAYDALGHCISKTTFPPAPSLPITTTRIHDSGGSGRGWFIDDVEVVIEERVAGAVSQIMINTRGLGDLSLQVAAFTATGKTFYYHHDDLGNVVALTDAAGNPIEKYMYDDYGEVTFFGPDSTPLVGSDGMPVTESPAGNRFLFRGMEWEPALRKYRGTMGQAQSNPLYEENVMGGSNPLYDPKTGRYTSRQAGNVGDALGALRCVGHNGFTFANGNPWSPSQLTGRPVGQPAAAGLGAHVQRILNWTAVRSLVQDFEKNTEGVSGGFGLISAPGGSGGSAYKVRWGVAWYDGLPTAGRLRGSPLRGSPLRGSGMTQLPATSTGL